MSQILFVCSHLVGRTRAAGEYANRLTEHGHTVVLACPASVMQHLSHCNAKLVEIPGMKLGGPNRKKRVPLAGFLPARRRKALCKLEQSLELSDFEHLLAADRPDLAIIDFEMRPHVIVALGMSVPVALLTTMFTSRPGSKSPPLDSEIVPTSGNAVQVWTAWIRLWVRWRGQMFTRWRRSAGTDYFSLLRYIADRRGVPLNQFITRWWWHVPFSWRELPLLVLHSPALDFPVSPDPNLHYVGSMLADAHSTTPQELEIIQLAKHAKSNGKKVVYVAFGSILTMKASVIDRLWRAVRTFEDIIVIQSTGRKELPATAEKPDNVHLVDWAPQRAILPLADVAVIHAGVNSLVESIMGETPMLCYRTSWLDTAGNIARITHHGIGISLSLDADEEVVRAALRDILDDPTYVTRCAQVREYYAAYETEKTAVAVVEKLLRNARG